MNSASSQWLYALASAHGIELRQPASQQLITEAERNLGPLPKDLRDFYAVSNGLELNHFSILPIADRRNIKKTWDSIERANDLSASKFPGIDQAVLTRFLIFAYIGGGDFAAYERNDGTIWFSTRDAISQTDLDLQGFIFAMVKEANEP